MAFIVADRVKETSTSEGTGPITLGGAVLGFSAFSARCTTGDTCYYAIQAVDGAGVPTGEWECGLGTYSGANTLTRTTVTSSSNSDAAVSFAAGTKQVFITLPAAQVARMREKLAAARTYYVRTDGSDSNSGLANTSGGAFLTIQKAVDVSTSLDANTQQVTVQIADGTYTGTVTLAPMLGSLPLIIRGNNGTPANVHVNVTGNAFTAVAGGCYAQILDMKITASSIALFVQGGVVEYGNVNFGAAAVHVLPQYNGRTKALANYAISGGGLAHIRIREGGKGEIVAKTVTITGTPAFSSAFAEGINGGLLAIDGNTWSGSATGKRYIANSNSWIASAGATLPGNAAGTTDGFGGYA